MYTERYMIQHKEIRDLMDQILVIIQKREVEKESDTVVSSLNKLSGILNVHLAGEDKYLYPSVEKSADVTLHNMALRYQKEMGGLCEVFVKFKNSYNTKNKMTGHEAEFAVEAKKVFGEITKRMDREESEFYPAVNKKL